MTCWDYSLAIVREPDRFAAADVVHGPIGSAVSALPVAALAALLPIFPTYVWVGGRTAAGPRGATLRTPVRRVT